MVDQRTLAPPCQVLARHVLAGFYRRPSVTRDGIAPAGPPTAIYSAINSDECPI
jgi:hypothetical protein